MNEEHATRSSSDRWRKARDLAQVTHEIYSTFALMIIAGGREASRQSAMTIAAERSLLQRKMVQ